MRLEIRMNQSEFLQGRGKKESQPTIMYYDGNNGGWAKRYEFKSKELKRFSLKNRILFLVLRIVWDILA